MGRFLVIISLFIAVCAQAQTATNLVFFSIKDMTGSTNITQFTLTADAFFNPYSPDGLNLAGNPAMTFPLVNGTNTVALWPGGYTLTVQGWARSPHFNVYNTNVTVNVLYLITNGLPQPINQIYGFGYLPFWAVTPPQFLTNILNTITNLQYALTNGVGTNVTQIITNIMVVQTLVSNIIVETASIENGYTLVPTQTTNIWLDCGKTNNVGQDLIYASLSASSDVNILGFTNQVLWDVLSINIIASGGNRNIYIPQYARFTTNGGWFSANSKYQLVLTNGNELRMTFQTNPISTSVQWQSFGQ